MQIWYSEREWVIMENIQRDDVSIQQIRIFLTAAQTNSFSATAQQLYLTQPTVSKWMAKLEKQMGCRLFSRYAGGVHLTKQGEAVYDSWKHMVEVYDNSVADLDELEGRRRTLRIGVLTHLRFVPELNEIRLKFVAQHPEIEVVLEAYDLKELRQRLLHGDLDVAYIYSFDFDDDDGLNILPIRKVDTYLAGLPEAFENPDAEGYHTLLLVSRSESRRGGELAMTACHDMGFRFNKVRYFPNIASVELAARQGKGVMICGSYIFQKNEPLMRFPIPKEHVSNEVALAWLPGVEKPSTLALVQCVENFLKKDK